MKVAQKSFQGSNHCTFWQVREEKFVALVTVHTAAD